MVSFGETSRGGCGSVGTKTRRSQSGSPVAGALDEGSPGDDPVTKGGPRGGKESKTVAFKLSLLVSPLVPFFLFFQLRET